MLPTYRPGDIVLAWRWFKPRAGLVVVAEGPDCPLIKRIKRVSAEGCWLEGDNPVASTDSRTYGLFPPQRLAARILLRLEG